MSILNVNTLQPVGSGQTITVTAANITASSSAFTVGSITNTSGSTVVAAGTTAAPSISPTGDSNTGIFFPSADTIAFAEGGAEALRITSSADVGIGTATPSNYFSYDLVVKSRQNTGGVTIAANSTSDTNYLMFADGTSGNAAYRGYINYSHSDDSLNIASAGSVRVTIDSSGNFNLVNTAGIMTAFKYETPALINNHFKSNSTSSNAYVRMYASAGTGQWDIYGNNANLRFSDNASAGNIQMDRPLVMNSQNIVMSSGNGIDFSATANSSGTMSSELLNDYEFGSWTPSAYLSYNPTGGRSVSSSFQNGRYIKIGRQVTIWFNFNYTLSGTGTFNMGVSGLPFGVDPDISFVCGGAREMSANGYWFQCESVGSGGANIGVLRRYDNAGPPEPSGQMYGYATYGST